MSGFHVGQRVVCVDDIKANSKPSTILTKGRVYTVRRVISAWPYWPICKFQSGQGIWLQEITREVDRDGREHPFNAERFRPLDERRLDVFRRLLAPRPHERATT